MTPPKQLARAATAGNTTVNNRTLIYNAAPGRSLDSEKDLYDALGKAGGWLGAA